MDKARVRADRLAARSGAAVDDGAGAALAVRVLSLLTAAPTTVAAYRSLPDEAPTGPLLDALHRAGHRVLLPVLRADRDLDWAPAAPGDPGRPGLRGTSVPTGPPLGVEAVAQAALVVVPAVACDRAGHRLGRGGGSYDRALSRVRPGTPVVALVHDLDLLDDVPVEPHDVGVDVVVSPRRTLVVPRA